MLLDIARTVAPAAPLLTLDSIKAQVEVEHDTHNALLAQMAKSVEEHLDGYTGELGRALVNQTWTLYLPRFPGSPVLRLPMPPLVSVTSVAYRDALGAPTTFPTSKYHVLDGRRAEIRLAAGESWPATEDHPRAVTITFVCGYGPTGEDVPADIRQAALLMVGDLYAHRETSVEGTISSRINMTTTVDLKLSKYRLPRV